MLLAGDYKAGLQRIAKEIDTHVDLRIESSVTKSLGMNVDYRIGAGSSNISHP